MKTYLTLLAGFAVSALIVACGGSNSSNNNNNNVIYNCPAGTTYQNGYCVGTNGTVSTSTAVGFYSENWHDRNLNITGGNFREFLRNAMGVCDQAHANGGLANCNAWTSGAFDIVIQAPNIQSNTLQVTFRAKPQYNPNAWGYYQLPSLGQFAGAMLGVPILNTAGGATRNPLVLNMAVSVTNNYQGFEARGYGDFYTAANRSLIQIQIAQGKLEDGFFDFRLAYRGEIMATGRFIRCSTADCGLAKPIGTF